MKKLSPPSRTILFAVIGIVLFFFSAAFGSGTATSQAPPPPTDIDLEIGSTDGILIWSVLIVLIIILPILWNWFLTTRKEK